MCGEDDDFSDDDVEEVQESQQSQEQFNNTYVEDLPSEDGEDGSNDIRILMATDIHVGYGENKPSIHSDSLNTFEEVLQIAKREKVDMVLLGGDLFHENHPTREMVHGVTRLLRQYCMGDDEVSLEFVSDPTVNFTHSNFDRVNYEDCNLNVGLPVFTIHGNHDDMAGKGLTALDVLHEAGLINLFGKFDEVDMYDIFPILLRKGTTRLALYGLGSQRDDRIARAFMEERVSFKRPRHEPEGWFNIFTLHQNRPKRSTLRSTGAFLPEQFIPTFLDLVLWGHEHECRIVPEYKESADAVGDGLFIIQPGSTVATSLSVEEAHPRHVALVTVRGRKFIFKPIKLETPRQVIVDEMTIDKCPANMLSMLPVHGTRPSEPLPDERWIEERLEGLIRKASKERGSRQPALPLIRLKVNYAGPWQNVPQANGRRIGGRFKDRVANPHEMVVTRKIREKGRKKKDGKSGDVFVTRGGEGPTPSSVEQVVARHFCSAPLEDRLSILTDEKILDALQIFAQDDSKTASTLFKTKLTEQVDKMKDMLKKMPVPEAEDGSLLDDAQMEEQIRWDLRKLKEQRYANDGIPGVNAV